MITTKIDFGSGPVIVSCRSIWKPIVGEFWEVRETISGRWRGFFDLDDLIDLMAGQHGR
jgi:hypothetical protein